MKNGMRGVLVAAAAAVAVTAVTAAAQDDTARRDRRRERVQGGAMMNERGGPSAGGQRGMGMGRETMLAHFVSNPVMAERLGLKSNQVAELSGRMDAIQKEKVKVRAELEIAGMDQAKLLSAEKIDEAALKAAVEKTGAIHTRLAMLEIQPIVELKKVLTPAQIAMAKEMIRERMRERMGPEGSARGEEGGRREGPDAPPEPPPAPEGE